jgi:hypothetical protein
MKLLEDPCESCAVEEGEIVLETEHGDLFVCHKCAKRLRKARKKVNHGDPPVE